VASITASVTVAKIKPTNFKPPRSTMVFPCRLSRCFIGQAQGSEFVIRKFVPADAGIADSS
jgi:hypothetical protein